MPQNFDEAVHKADVLLEALSWIRQFRDRHVVIKLGGSAMEETAAVKSFLTDVIFMSTVGMRPILVHGGGKAINAASAKANRRRPRPSGGSLRSTIGAERMALVMTTSSLT